MAKAKSQRAKEKEMEMGKETREMENPEKDLETIWMEKIPTTTSTRERGKETKERAKETKETGRAMTMPKAKERLPTPLNMFYSQPRSRQHLILAMFPNHPKPHSNLPTHLHHLQVHRQLGILP